MYRADLLMKLRVALLLVLLDGLSEAAGACELILSQPEFLRSDIELSMSQGYDDVARVLSICAANACVLRSASSSPL